MFCPKCGTDMSDNATACPKCGEPVATKKRGMPMVCFFLGFLLSFVGLIIAAIVDKQNWVKALYGMIVAAVFGTIAVFAWGEVSSRNELAKLQSARESVDNISNAMTSYYLEYRKRPRELSELVTAEKGKEPILQGGSAALMDPWGHEYKMEAKGKKYTISSAGPDGVFGTDDDIKR